MTLIKCSECGNNISDKATSCPHCGVSRTSALKKNHGCGTLIIIIAIVLLVHSFWQRNKLPPAHTNTSTSTKQWTVTGRQGQGVIFIVMNRDVAADKDAYRRAAEAECPRDWCQAMFWVSGTAYANALPLSPAQSNDQVALYMRNTSTGKSEFIWHCDAFPGTPDSECYTN